MFLREQKKFSIDAYRQCFPPASFVIQFGVTREPKSRQISSACNFDHGHGIMARGVCVIDPWNGPWKFENV